MRYARAAFVLIRPYSSLLAFLSILVPLAARTHEIWFSIQRATPLLFISMCTFLTNALDDIDKDKENHPERPLPSGQVGPEFVTVFYFICLASALLSIRFGVGTSRIAFLYYSLLIACISYSYVVEYLPTIKPVYVASSAAVPILIIIAYLPDEASFQWVGIAFFFFNLGRELCKDIPDRAGDPVSFLHTISPQSMAKFAFACQAVGIIIMFMQVDDLLDLFAIIVMAALLAIAWFYWFQLGLPRVTAALTKGILFCGLYFLL